MIACSAVLIATPWYKDILDSPIIIHLKTSCLYQPFYGEVKIVNNGLGPAIIKKLRFFKDGEEINANGFCTFYDLICIRLGQERIQISTEEIKEIFRIYSKEFRDSEDDRDYLGVGKSLTLLSFCARSDQDNELIERIFCGVEMELVYTNLYYTSYNPSFTHTENKESTRTEDPFERTVKKRLSYFKPNWMAFHPNS